MKRIIGILLSLILLFSFAGCQKQDSAKESESGNSYLMESHDLEKDIYITDMKRVGDSFYLVCSMNHDNVTAYKRLIFNPDDKSITEAPLELVIDLQEELQPGNNLINGLAPIINPDGTIEALEFKQIMNDKWETLSEEHYYNRYDQNGILISSEPFKSKFGISDDSYIGLFHKDSKGNYLIGGSGEPLKIYSSDYSIIGEVPNSNVITFLTESAAGTVIASWLDGAQFHIATIDTVQCQMKETVLLDNTQNSYTFWPYIGNQILYVNGTDIYSCDVITSEQNKLFSCTYNNLSVDFIHGIYPLENDRLLVYYYDYFSNEISLVFLTPVDAETLEARTELILASINAQPDVQSAIDAFNRSNKDYRITLVDYGEHTKDYAKALEALQKDLIAGDVPDILDIRNNNFPWQSWAAKNILTDLYPLMDADSALKKDDLLENVQNSYEVNGSLYLLPSSFTIDCLMTKSSNVNGIASLTPEIMLEMEQNLAPESRLFYWENKENIMMNMVYQNIHSFVNYETGECYFNTPEFKAILEYANSKPAEFNLDDGSAGIAGALRSNEVIFHNLTIRSCADYQFFKTLFGGDVSCLSFQNNNASGHKLSLFGSAFAITDSCEHKDPAWQFIQSYQKQNSRMPYGIPSTQSGLEAYLTEAGNNSEITSYTVDDVVLELGAPTEEDLSEIKEIISHSDTCSYTDSFLLSMMEEELSPYFAGQKTADEVIEILQNRCSVYLKEG